MNSSHDLTALLDRVAAGEDGAAVRADLRRVTRVRGDRNVAQVGNNNIALNGAHDIHIDNRVYRGAEADAIRRALEQALIGSTRLRGAGGLLITLGMIIVLVGMGMFFYGLIGVMSAGPGRTTFPPPLLLRGFGVAAGGIGIAIVGGLVSAWQRH